MGNRFVRATCNNAGVTFIHVFGEIFTGFFFFSPRFTKVIKALLMGRKTVDMQNLHKLILMKYDDMAS